MSEIFISYAWSGESEAITDALEQKFGEKGIKLVRDKTDLGYKELIREFMQELGQGKCVIAVISDKYLKSKNCMYELLEISRNGEFYDRIFPIVLKDARIYDVMERLNYIEYWEGKIKELEEGMKRVSLANLQGFREEIDLYTEIRNKIAGLVDTLRNMNTLTAQMHQESGFKEVVAAIAKRLDEDTELPPPDKNLLIGIQNNYHPEQNLPKSSDFPLGLERLPFELIFKDHKYDGQLVCIQLDFIEHNISNERIAIILVLDITFGQVDELFPYQNGSVQSEGYLRFGIKHGKLGIELQNGSMPLAQRIFTGDQQQRWRINSTGIEENPIWEFETNEGSRVLEGLCSAERLGIVNLSDLSCNLKASFKVQINSNDLEITAQDGAWGDTDTLQNIETKRRAFFRQVVEPKLQEYISKVVLQYDSTSNS